MIYSVDFKKLTEKINPLSFVKYLKILVGCNSQQRKLTSKYFKLVNQIVIFSSHNPDES